MPALVMFERVQFRKLMSWKEGAIVNWSLLLRWPLCFTTAPKVFGSKVRLHIEIDSHHWPLTLPIYLDMDPWSTVTFVKSRTVTLPLIQIYSF